MKWLLKLLGANAAGEIKNARLVLRLTSLLLLILFLWAYFYEIDQTITAQGKVIASDRSQLVQTPDGGVLKELRVREGDRVEKGQIVAVFEQERADAAYKDALGKVSALTMSVARLQAEVTRQPFVIDAKLESDYPELAAVQKSLYTQRLQTLNQQIATLRTSLELALEEVRMNEPLVKSGDVSRAELMRMQRQANEIRLQISNADNKYRQDANTELTKATEDLNAAKQALADKTEVLSHTELTAPESGVVNNIKATTIGGVLRAGDELLEILPEGKLIVEAEVSPTDMADIKMGMPARVKLDAYDYSIFGAMEGKVVFISPDSITRDAAQMRAGQAPTYFRVRIEIEGAQLKDKVGEKINVRAGLTAQVDLLGQKRSVLSYITKPITKTLSESAGKR